MLIINLPPYKNFNNLMYWLEMQVKKGTPRETLWNELMFHYLLGDIEMQSKAGQILEELLYKRNVIGMRWEKLGYIGLAITAYEQNLKDKSRGMPYERLRVLYSKYHLYEKAIKVCDSFIALPDHPADIKKKEKFREHIKKLHVKNEDPKIPPDYPIVLLDNIPDCEIPEVIIQGEKISSKSGKAKYKLANSGEGIIEEFVLEHYAKKGYFGIFSENDYWRMIVGLLFWDIIFYPIPGMFYEDRNFPKQDMPMDFFEIDFYIRREGFIDKLISGIRGIDKSEMQELSIILDKNCRKYKGEPCRAINDWDKFSFSEVNIALEVLSPYQLMAILERLIFYFGEYRKGLPDLFLVKDNLPLFVECKEKHENLSEYQKSWHKYLVQKANIPVVICRVENF